MTFDTFDQSDQETWPNQHFDNFWHFFNLHGDLSLPISQCQILFQNRSTKREMGVPDNNYNLAWPLLFLRRCCWPIVRWHWLKNFHMKDDLKSQSVFIHLAYLSSTKLRSANGDKSCVFTQVHWMKQIWIITIRIDSTQVHFQNLDNYKVSSASPSHMCGMS